MGARADFPGFERDVAENGYVWWYLDAMSDDGQHCVTVIAFIGSVFSPYYARARGRGAGDPANHCAVNVVLYKGGAKRWALTERGRGELRRTASRLGIGPSSLNWNGRSMVVEVDEISVPLPSRIRGSITVLPQQVNETTLDLDGAGRHRWSPVSPRARVRVRMTSPALEWDGDAYLDCNAGDEPLEAAFTKWNWSRSTLADGGAAILYDATRRDGADTTLALHFPRGGEMQHFTAPPRTTLPATTVWRMPRDTRCMVGANPRIARTLEDTPFYSRSLLATTVKGQPVTAMHESLSLDRFTRPWVQTLLHFRMPRAR